MRKIGFLPVQKERCRSAESAEQRLRFRFWERQSLFLFNLKCKTSSLKIVFGSTACFVSDLVRNPEDRFSGIMALIAGIYQVPGKYLSMTSAAALSMSQRIL